MSGSNAISGITIVGALIAAGTESATIANIAGHLGRDLATINVVGGYLVTDRMLAMFKARKKSKSHDRCVSSTGPTSPRHPVHLGLKMLGTGDRARGQPVSAVGMLIAIVATLLLSGINYQWIVVGLLIGTAIGAVAAYAVKMTAMPEMVALFNGFGGLASLLVGWVEYHNDRLRRLFRHHLPSFFAVFIGGMTFTGSVFAYAKLAGKVHAGRSFSRPADRQRRSGPRSSCWAARSSACTRPSQSLAMYSGYPALTCARVLDESCRSAAGTCRW